MRAQYQDLTVGGELSPLEITMLRNHPRFNKTFIAYYDLPDTVNYLRCELWGSFIGAFVLESQENSRHVCIHPAITVELRHHVPALTELAIVLLLLDRKLPYCVTPESDRLLTNWIKRRHNWITTRSGSTIELKGEETKMLIHTLPDSWEPKHLTDQVSIRWS